MARHVIYSAYTVGKACEICAAGFILYAAGWFGPFVWMLRWKSRNELRMLHAAVTFGAALLMVRGCLSL